MRISNRPALRARCTCLEVLRPNHAQVVYAKHETYRIEDVGLSGAVQSRD
jgi:hypothetical protein